MKKCLIVVDYQIDFINGSLGFPKAEKLAPGIATLINEFHKQQQDVIFTLDSHDSTYLSTQEGKHLPIPHCQIRTVGHQLHPLIEKVKHQNDKVYYKNRFGSLSLANDLANSDYQQVELVGLVTNICVIANALLAKTALPEARIIVHQNLCASFDEELHTQALNIMRGLQIEVL